MTLSGFRSFGFFGICCVLASDACGTSTTGFATPDAAAGSALDSGASFDAAFGTDVGGSDADGSGSSGSDTAGLADGSTAAGDDATGNPIDAADDTAATPPDGAPSGSFQNSLGMRFVPVAGTSVLFSIWETRRQDYVAYATATGTPVPEPDFTETALDPKAAISRAQAEAFAAWLTTKEQNDHTLSAAGSYRLPTDVEFDAAMGVGPNASVYPWGSTFPPPDHFANYGISHDGFMYTAPVGSFPANEQGLFDVPGNLWEWIGEGCTSGGAFLVRGAGWNAAGTTYMARAFHYCFGSDLVGHHNVGFRIVLAGTR
jgi:hypothetical protein